MKMAFHEQDPDVVRWGLHHLMDICSVSNAGSPGAFTRYDKDCSSVEYEGYCVSNYANVENDEMIARAFQEELSRLTLEERHGSPQEDHQKESVLAQDWLAPSKRHVQRLRDFMNKTWKTENRRCNSSSSFEERSGDYAINRVPQRWQMSRVLTHVPKVNGEVPSADEATSDHQRLMDRLQLYDLVELKVSGDGNCQFRSLSDQIYRSSEHHKLVREQVAHQLKFYPELYAAYVPMAYDDYLKKISTDGEWGDHVTLQAAADVFGVKIFVLTSFKDTCYIEILPCAQKSKRIIFLSFWAEVHYNSIYPEGGNLHDLYIIKYLKCRHLDVYAYFVLACCCLELQFSNTIYEILSGATKHGAEEKEKMVDARGLNCMQQLFPIVSVYLVHVVVDLITKVAYERALHLQPETRLSTLTILANHHLENNRETVKVLGFTISCGEVFVLEFKCITFRLECKYLNKVLEEHKSSSANWLKEQFCHKAFF
ncbi:LOW QUALITY PROTEIN: hypothetical protein OSB04_026891 [Centaurea solstitialis]|uniref:ubiquitinyl hydrolase 1 n=1 Tax=Centaurea solstitialis TaxID=347529 RepID=A0AA38SQ99_9ASTR|nr:LOW QUALITY PROTEIN: hypothetical protein OSB04_026891 [Centaurea solstitialis]